MSDIEYSVIKSDVIKSFDSISISLLTFNNLRSSVGQLVEH